MQVWQFRNNAEMIYILSIGLKEIRLFLNSTNKKYPEMSKKIHSTEARILDNTWLYIYTYESPKTQSREPTGTNECCCSCCKRFDSANRKIDSTNTFNMNGNALIIA